MENNELISNGKKENVGAAYYELEMGNVYYDLTEGDNRIELQENETVIIKPGHRVVLITKEKLNLPDNILGRIISKGSLFSIGLSPISTNADPGFKGQIGIVTQNFSDKYIELAQNEAIAKIDFNLLDEDSSAPYSGQHGFATKIWPIKHHLQKTYNDLRNDKRIGSEKTESHSILPKLVSNSLKKLEKQQARINKGLAFFLVIQLVLLCMISTEFIDPIIAILVNVCSSIITFFFINKK